MNRIAAGTLCLTLLAVSPAGAQDAVEPDPAEVLPLADESLLMDVIRAGNTMVTVGTRGHVLTSTDGESWNQSGDVPVRAALTQVDFAGGGLWAVGHDSAIVHSADMGQSWTLQQFEPEWERPLLDVLFLDARRGFAIGAYGLFQKTSDGGSTWEEVPMDELVTSEAIDWPEQSGAELMAEDPEAYYDASARVDKGCYEFMECHLNDIVRLDDGRMMMVAERGYGFRSTDDGETWESFRFPYAGSMFGVVEQRDCLIAFGLRGHVQKSCDFGDSWTQIDTGSDSTLLGGMVDGNGTVIMVGASSTVVHLPVDGQPSVSSEQLGSDFAAVAPLPGENALVVAGEEGVSLIAGDES